MVRGVAISPVTAVLAAFLAALALVWAAPLAWMLVASFRPQSYGGLNMASLLPDFAPTLHNLSSAWGNAPFPLLLLNTLIVVAGVLAVQLTTITLAGYAFARLTFKGKTFLFYIFLLQLMIAPPVLIVPNLKTIVRLGLYDHLAGVMAPYFASAFGTFLMRQTFLSIPRDFEEAAIMEGAGLLRIIKDILLPMAKPALAAFSVVSVATHWNEFLWPLIVTTSPSNQTLTVGLATFTLGAESAKEWGVLAAGTMFVMLPLGAAFLCWQRQFINSFVFSGIKG